jgi:hypothetical protein
MQGAFNNSLLFAAIYFLCRVSLHHRFTCRVSNAQTVTSKICLMFPRPAISVYSLLAWWALLSCVYYLVKNSAFAAEMYVLRRHAAEIFINRALYNHT